MKLNNISILLLTFVHLVGYPQTEHPFSESVKDLSQKYDSIYDPSKETIVFTGSSSIRFWTSLEQSFPEHQIINTGFGGSQASDLLFFVDELVLKYNPTQVFIYEGDNDLWEKKRPNEIIRTTSEIINRIKEKDRHTQIVLISAKPSMIRWPMRGKYKRLNRKLKRLSLSDPTLAFADVWYPMLDKRKLMTDIFIEDGLHMNQKGYDIWYTALYNFINHPK